MHLNSCCDRLWNASTEARRNPCQVPCLVVNRALGLLGLDPQRALWAALPWATWTQRAIGGISSCSAWPRSAPSGQSCHGPNSFGESWEALPFSPTPLCAASRRTSATAPVMPTAKPRQPSVPAPRTSRPRLEERLEVSAILVPWQFALLRLLCRRAVLWTRHQPTRAGFPCSRSWRTLWAHQHWL